MNKYEEHLFFKEQFNPLDVNISPSAFRQALRATSWEIRIADLREKRRLAPQEIDEPYIFTLFRQLPEGEKYCRIFDRAIALWFDGPPCFIDAHYWQGRFKLSVGWASFNKDGSDIPF